MNRYTFRNNIENESSNLGLILKCGTIEVIKDKNRKIVHFSYPIKNTDNTQFNIEYHPNTRKVLIVYNQKKSINKNNTNLKQLIINLEKLLSY